MTHDLFGGMRDQEHRAAATDQLLETPEALGLKLYITHRQGFVDDEDVGVDAGRHRERQAHIHARGIQLDRPLQEIADVGEGRDLRQPRSISRFDRPRMAALMRTFSRPVNSGLKPAPVPAGRPAAR